MDDTNLFLCLDTTRIETQWAGLAPQTNYYAVRDHFNLRLIDTQSDYALYAVSAR